MQANRNLSWTAKLRAGWLGSTAILPAMLALAGAAQAQVAPGAAPVGGRVVAGGASIAQTPGLTQVTQSTERAAIDWQQFNVGRDHQVNFQQPSAAAWTLNRVTGPDPSVIAGRVTANGGVAFVNQSGMVFAAGAEVNVASLIASAPNITNQNFMAGRMVFDGPARPGARIENAGKITVAQQGLAALVAPEVVNRGVIQARMGKVALAGAEAYTLDLAGDGLLSIDVTQSVRTAPDGGAALVTNSGTIRAEGGSVLLTADAASGLVETLVANTGRIAANTIPASTGGPERAGVVSVQARGGGVRVDGVIATTGGANASGGTIAVNADAAVTLSASARLNASGGSGGGQVFVGTSGVGVNQRLAARTTVARGATIRADAKRNSNGGTVSVNAQQTTDFAGSISARGGPQGGDGGFVETSGQGTMLLTGSVDVRAPAGQAGTLLLDPQDILITGSVSTTPDPVAAGNGTVLAASAPSNGTLTIGSNQIQNFAGTVRLEATRNITITGQVAKTNGGLQLLAQNGVLDVQNLVASTGNLSATAASVRVRPGAALGSLGVLTVTSTVGGITVDPNGGLFSGTRITITSQAGFNNAGRIAGGTTAVVGGVVGAAGTTSNAVQVLATGDIVNTGIITGTGGGAPIASGGTLVAVFLQTAGTITNSGTIQTSVRPDGTGGNLRLDTSGLNSNINNNAPINGGAIINSGALTADTRVSLTSNTSVQNDGAITGGLIAGGQDTNAVALSANTTITNSASGIIIGNGGGQLTNNGANSISAVTLTTAGGNINNAGTIQSVAVGGNYGAISITSGAAFTNSGQVNSVRNTIVSADSSIQNSGTIAARTGRVSLTATGNNLQSGAAITLSGGLVTTLGEPPPNPPPTNPGRITLTATNGDISLTGNATISAQADVLINAGNGGVSLDGAVINAGGTFRVDATRQLTITDEIGSIRFDSVNVQAANLIGHVAPGGSNIDLDQAVFNIGQAVLLSAPGGITNYDSTASRIAPLVAGQFPAIIFDTRTTAAALSDIPAGVGADSAGQPAAAQPTQLSLFGAAAATGAGNVPNLLLDAGRSSLFLLLDSGSASGTLTAGRLGVLGLNGSVNLSGTLGGQAGAGAAGLGSLSPQIFVAAAQQYQFNGCPLGSINCSIPITQTLLSIVPINLPNVLADVNAAVDATSELRNLLVPRPDVVRFRPLQGRLSDPDVLLPNVVEQDY